MNIITVQPGIPGYGNRVWIFFNDWLEAEVVVQKAVRKLCIWGDYDKRWPSEELCNYRKGEDIISFEVSNENLGYMVTALVVGKLPEVNTLPIRIVCQNGIVEATNE